MRWWSPTTVLATKTPSASALLGMVVAPFLTSLPALVAVVLAIRARREGHPHARAALVTSVACLLLATWFWLVLGPAFGSS